MIREARDAARDAARTEIDEQLTTSCERAAALCFRVIVSAAAAAVLVYIDCTQY